MSQHILGAQLYINRSDDLPRIGEWVQQMSEDGLTLIRLFMNWDLIEPRQGQWEWARFDHVFDCAHDRGMRVVPTLMSVSPPGWMHASNGSQDIGDLDDASFWQAGMGYIYKVVNRYREHPALDSWIIWNEPARVLNRQQPQVQKNFATYLKEKYWHTDRLNERYFQQSNNFEEVFEQHNQYASALEFLSYAEDIDWLNFTVADLSLKLQKIADAVRAVDSNHPLHVNPHRISQCLSESGQSIWQEARITDYIGSSVHPPWHSVRFPDERIDQSVAMFADYMRSATCHPEGKFWISELQGGPTIFSAFKSSGPRPEDLRRWIWEGVASGAEATMFWCYNCRNDGFEAGEWGLLNNNNKKTERLKAITTVGEQLHDLKEILNPCTADKGEIGILVSDASWNLSLLEGEGEDVQNPRNKQMASDAVCGAYCMVSDLDYEVSFIHESNIANTDWREDIKILIVPGCTSLENNTLTHLINFAQAGGLVIADGMCGWKTPWGALANNDELLQELFGAEVHDLFGGSAEFIQYQDHKISHSLLQISFIDNESCIARHTDGSSGIIQKQHGSGNAIRIGTNFFQYYFMKFNSDYLDIFSSLTDSHSSKALRFGAHAPTLRIRRLRHPNGYVYILLNRGEDQELTISSADAFEITDEHGNNIDTAAFTMNKNEIRILAVQTSTHTIPSPS